MVSHGWRVGSLAVIYCIFLSKSETHSIGWETIHSQTLGKSIRVYHRRQDHFFSSYFVVSIITFICLLLLLLLPYLLLPQQQNSNNLKLSHSLLSMLSPLSPMCALLAETHLTRFAGPWATRLSCSEGHGLASMGRYTRHSLSSIPRRNCGTRKY